MSQRKKDKKQKKKERQAEQAKSEKACFDIVQLLSTEQIDTKPNLAKFLDTYVKDIHASIGSSKISFYPNYRYELAKLFVRFLDGHELVYILNTLPNGQNYFLYDGVDEQTLTHKDIVVVEKFFNFLFDFKFISTERNSKCA